MDSDCIEEKDLREKVDFSIVSSDFELRMRHQGVVYSRFGYRLVWQEGTERLFLLGEGRANSGVFRENLYLQTGDFGLVKVREGVIFSV